MSLKVVSSRQILMVSEWLGFDCILHVSYHIAHSRTLHKSRVAHNALTCISLILTVTLPNLRNIYQSRTSVTHSAAPRMPLFCSYHILTSSVIYY